MIMLLFIFLFFLRIVLKIIKNYNVKTVFMIILRKK